MNNACVRAELHCVVAAVVVVVVAVVLVVGFGVVAIGEEIGDADAGVAAAGGSTFCFFAAGVRACAAIVFLN